MGFLDVMNNIGAATSAASGVGSLLFGQRMSRANARYQMKLQKELLATQQGYAVQNAATDYARQRELMQDTSLLTKLGRQNAGLSTAGDYNNVSASAPQITSPSVPGAPSIADPNQTLLSGAKQIQDSVTSLTQQRAAAAQAEGLEMQNDITRKALNEKVLGAKGEGLKANAEGKKAVATLPSDVQQAKDNAKLTNNDLWKSENEAAYASANAMSSANALLAQSLAAHEMYEKAKADKTMSNEQLQLFKDTYEFSVQAAQQNVVNLRKQGAAIDASADASRASAAASRSQSNVLETQAEYNRRTMNYRVERARLDNIPKDIKETLMRNKWMQRYVDDIEHGRKPSYEVKWHYDQLMLEFGLHTDSHGIGAAVDAIMR